MLQLSRQPRLARIAVFVLLVFTLKAGADTPVIADSLEMYAGQALVQEAPGNLTRVAVGNGKLLQVKMVGEREMVLIANQAGDTSVQLWMADGSQRSVSVHVGAGNAQDTAAQITQMLGDDSPVKVAAVGTNVVLTGNSLSAADSDHINAIKKLYPQVLDFTSQKAVEMRPMVMMHVSIMEFDKKAENELGVQWDTSIAGPGAGLVRDAVSNSYYRLTSSAFSGLDASGANATLPLKVSGAAGYFGLASSIGSTINLLETTGNAWELATPQLAARSGGKADFLVGGEVPIPISQALGQTTVEYKEYGIKLHIEPIVDNDGNISTDIETEVSKIDNSVSVDGYPGFTTRRASAEMNVHTGQTIVISGLVDASASKDFNSMPGLGDIPILGALFRSRDFQKARTDLVIFVTPEVVDANAPSNLKTVEHSNRMRDDLRKTAGSDIVD